MSAGRILVTGGSGFIGRRTLPRLKAKGFEVHAPASKECDLLDSAAARQLVERLRPTHLLHLAWIAKPGVFWTSPENLTWLAAGIELVRSFYACGGKRAVGVGSCAEYAESASPCVEEATPIAPATPYGRAKDAMHKALREAAAARGWAWARLFFPYGPGEPPGRFIPSVVDGLLRATPVACTHGRQVRDFVYADDVADACVALAAGEASGAYNVCSGEGASLREVAALIAAEAGHGELARFGERPAPAYDPPFIVGDPAKLRREHGWAAATPLAAGLRQTVAAHRRILEENPQ